MNHALNRSSAIRRFEGSDAVEICDGITFDFYTGLPHVAFQQDTSEQSYFPDEPFLSLKCLESKLRGEIWGVDMALRYVV